jgi:hypothetical protein
VATRVGTTAELAAAIDRLPWQTVGPYSTKLLEASRDVSAASLVGVAGSDVQVPESCANRPDCRQRVTFSISRRLRNVQCVAVEQVVYLSSCAAFVMNDVTVRFRAAMVDTHPSGWNYVPVVYVLPSCETPCLDDELRCAPTNLCFPESDFVSFCRLCLLEDKRRCACLTKYGQKHEGAECAYNASGDVLCGGTCRKGVCTYEDEPWAGCP